MWDEQRVFQGLQFVLVFRLVRVLNWCRFDDLPLRKQQVFDFLQYFCPCVLGNEFNAIIAGFQRNIPLKFPSTILSSNCSLMSSSRSSSSSSSLSFSVIQSIRSCSDL